MKVIKYASVSVVLLTMLLTTACGPSSNKSQDNPQLQTTANFSGGRTAKKASLDQSFEAPTQIFAPTIAGDSPAQPWNFPNDPAKVIEAVHAWLSTATVTQVHIPKQNANLHFMDYIGPADLDFIDQSGNRIMIAPAYYITHGSRGYYPKLIRNVISYKDAKGTTYLKCPQLFQWLSIDSNWGSEFRMESYTQADKRAIAEVKASKWGGSFTSLFPGTPGIDHKDIPHGGPAPIKVSIKTSKLPATVETLVDADGSNLKVEFVEVWNNGKGQHRWTYVISPNETILKHSESGDTAPQDWQ